MGPRAQQLGTLVCMLYSGCAAQHAAPLLSEFSVTAQGSDAGGDFCRDFQLTPAQAEWFFARAKVIDPAQEHDEFVHLPCWVRGTAISGRTRWQWEVRAGGTATLHGPTTTLQIGCKECDSVLGGSKPL